MGLSAGLRACIRDKYACAAYVNSALAASGPGRKLVIYQDHLTEFCKIDKKETHTRDELFQRFWQTIGPKLFNRNSPVEALVVGCDDRKFVPTWKARTQAERKEGVQRAEAKAGVEPPKPYTEQDPLDDGAVDLKRLAKTDRRGTWLWNSYMPRIRQCMRDGCPEGRRLILDWDREMGAMVVDSQGEVSWLEQHHMLGEADPAAMWWVANYAPERKDIDFHVVSNDSDVLAVYTLAHDVCGEHDRRVFMHHDDKAGVMIDLGVMVQQLRRTTRIHSCGVLGAWMVSCGTDFFDRTRVAWRITEETLLEAWRDVSTDGTLRQVLDEVLRLAWSAKRACVVQVPERFRKLASVLTHDELRFEFPHFPAPSVCDAEFARFEFNLQYWAQAHTGLQPHGSLVKRS